MDDDVSRQLAKARQLLEESKAKIAAQDDSEELPFFMKDTTPVEESDEVEKKRKNVTKSQNDEDLITTDGELMAALSEEENWEARPLGDVFEKESKAVVRKLADRDVAASIMNLRMSMQGEDYKKIFDKANWFIGDY